MKRFSLFFGDIIKCVLWCVGSMADFREEALEGTYNLYDAFVDEDCRKAYSAKGLSPGACMLSNNSLPFIGADAFIVQAQTDKYSTYFTTASLIFLNVYVVVAAVLSLKVTIAFQVITNTKRLNKHF